MREYTTDTPVFKESIPIVEENDLVNEENDNAAAKQLLQNILVLMKTKVNMEIGKSLVSETEREVWNGIYEQATGYVDLAIANLINGAPSTLDTLGEIANAMSDNADVVAALNAAIGTKANQAEMESLLGTKLSKTGDSKDNTITFTSSDTTTPSGWTNVSVLQSGETHKSFVQKVSTMFKNLRYLWKLYGNNDISQLGDGTITGALNSLNTGLAKVGTIVGGKIITTTVPPLVETTIVTITLSPGKWIIMANVWVTDTSLVNLTIKGVMGVMGELRQPQVSGIVEPTTQTEYKIICTQWEEHNITVVSPYVVAIRIA